MGIRIALRMLAHRKLRFAFTVVGLGFLHLLSASQAGLLIGWCHTIAAPIRHAGVDLWVMADRTPAYDYGPAIPRHRVYQVRNVEGVAWAEGLYVGWSMWQRPDGRRVSVQLVGLDRSSVGGPWDMREGDVDAVHLPNGVIVDALFREPLGVRAVGDEAELYGERAVVRGVSRGVRTFTASPFVFASMKNAARFDKSVRCDETTYVLVRLAPGADANVVARRIVAETPSVEALTPDAFSRRSVAYWLIETGMGLTVLITATLGVVVSGVVTSQTLFTTTQENLGNYATLLAIGFGRGRVLAMLATQGAALFLASGTLGAAGFALASVASADTPAPLELNAEAILVLVGATVGASLLGVAFAARPVFRLDPVSVFRA